MAEAAPRRLGCDLDVEITVALGIDPRYEAGHTDPAAFRGDHLGQLGSRRARQREEVGNRHWRQGRRFVRAALHGSEVRNSLHGRDDVRGIGVHDAPQHRHQEQPQDERRGEEPSLSRSVSSAPEGYRNT
jgi:hypothetical protein